MKTIQKFVPNGHTLQKIIASNRHNFHNLPESLKNGVSFRYSLKLRDKKGLKNLTPFREKCVAARPRSSHQIELF